MLAVVSVRLDLVGERIVKHALIIDDNVAVSRAIRDRLKQFGFVSFDWTWSERQALKAAAVRRPDLVVAGETIVGGSPLSMAGKLASSNRVPLLSIATRSFMLQRQIAGDEVVDGPYALIELDRALASMSPPGVATC
jgi:DNA-binding response OmpR family regulator